MAAALAQLLERSSAAIGRPLSEIGELPQSYESLKPLLSLRNGFYADYSALYVLPFDPNMAPSLNSSKKIATSLSKFEEAQSATVFAFDAFGMPFIIRQGCFGHLDYSTGAVEWMGNSAEEWSDAVLGDFRRYSGWPSVEMWQAEHGKLPVGTRLFPVRPFILGGQFETSNLKAVPIADGFGAAAQIYEQTKDLSEGAQVRIVVAD
ncbi:hypothetical protein [uncultured Maricaulis sp.]|uniref:hypothetical protein n=1 Tax=uncultured Maricaulis sp. TaxID=174710 RepID=UPI00262184E1|nr:hypothetical protein [uncultured Maricaulis sp.]